MDLTQKSIIVHRAQPESTLILYTHPVADSHSICATLLCTYMSPLLTRLSNLVKFQALKIPVVQPVRPKTGFQNAHIRFTVK